MSLLDLICTRLVNVKRQPDGSVLSACPVCASVGRDSTKTHLRVWPTGAFSCAAHQGEGEHNRAIRSLIRGHGDASESALISETEHLDADPRITEPKVYPESCLAELLPDYTYWLSRGISEAVLRRIGGGMASSERKSKLSSRYVLPCRDDKGRIVGFSARLLTESSFAPRYKILGRKAHFLFPPIAIVEAAVRATGDLILTEGCPDAMSCMTAGIDQVYVMFGVTLSSKLVGRIVALSPRRIIIATNNEGSGVGNRAAESIRQRLSSFVLPERVYVHLPPVKDLAMMTSDQIKDWYAGVGKAVTEPTVDAPAAPSEGGLEL